MATRALGTNGNTSLAAVRCGPYPLLSTGLPTRTGTQIPVNVALLLANIKDDLTNGNPVIPGSFQGTPGGNASPFGSLDPAGLLYIPNRGVLKVLAGDFVAYDSTGWPILVSANAIANGPWHSP